MGKSIEPIANLRDAESLMVAIDNFVCDEDPDGNIIAEWDRRAADGDHAELLSERVWALVESAQNFVEGETVYDDLPVAGILGLSDTDDAYDTLEVTGDEEVTSDFLDEWIGEVKWMIDCYNDKFATEVLQTFDTEYSQPGFYYSVMFKKNIRKDNEAAQKYVLEGLSELDDFDSLSLLARIVSSETDFKELGQRVFEKAEQKARDHDKYTEDYKSLAKKYGV